VSCDPGARWGLVPDGNVVVHIIDLVAVDEHQPVALANVSIERGLVFGRGHSVPCNPCGRPGDLFPNGGVTSLVANGIPTYVLEPVALTCILVKCGLVASRSEAMAGYPLAGWALVPDGDIVVDTIDSVAIHEDKAEALRDVRVKLGLVIRRGHAVVSDPGGRGFLLKDGGKARIIVHGVAANPSQAVALGSKGVERGLEVSRAQTVSSLPLSVDLDTEEEGQCPDENGEFHLYMSPV